jgi:hypothetical protein
MKQQWFLSLVLPSLFPCFLFFSRAAAQLTALFFSNGGSNQESESRMSKSTEILAIVGSLSGAEIARMLTISMFALTGTFNSWSIGASMLVKFTSPIQSMITHSPWRKKWRYSDCDLLVFSSSSTANQVKYFWKRSFSISHALFFFVSVLLNKLLDRDTYHSVTN